MRLILVRHGETSYNRHGIIQGSRSDTGLNKQGLDQVELIARAMTALGASAVYTSPLKRALSTAEAICRHCGIELFIVPDFVEIDAGELEGMSGLETIQKHGEFWTKWAAGDVTLTLPGGESLEKVQSRAWAQIEKIMEKHGDETVIVVSHLFVTLMIICRALGIDAGQLMRVRQDPASISVLELTATGNRLITFNDTCHLETL